MTRVLVTMNMVTSFSRLQAPAFRSVALRSSLKETDDSKQLAEITSVNVVEFLGWPFEVIGQAACVDMLRLQTSVTGTSRSSSFGREISPAEERTG